MGRTKKFLYNSISTALYQLTLMFSGFITVSVILKAYGSEINGLVSSINQFIVYFKLVEAGLASAAIYSLYKPLASNDYKAINKVVVAAKEFYTKSGYLFVLLTFALAFLYPLIVNVDGLTSNTVGVLVLVLGVNGALEFFTLAKYRALLTADQKTYVISLASMVYIIINTIIVVVLAKFQVEIVFLWSVAITSLFVRTFILIMYVKVNYKWLDFREEPNYNALAQRWDALYLQILGAIQVGSPIIILTIVTNDMKLVSIFSVYYMIIVGLNGILTIFKTGLFASFGDVITKGEKNILQKAYEEFEFFYYSIITVIFSIAFVMILPFIRIYTADITDANYELPLIGFLFVLNGFLHNLKTPQGMLVMSAGLFKETKLQTTIQGAIVIILGFALAPMFGLVGVLIASIISNLYRCIDLIIYIPNKVTELPVFNTVNRIIRSIISILVICAPFWFIKIDPLSYLSWSMFAGLIGIYSILVVGYFGFLFDRKNMSGVLKRLTNLSKR